MLHIILPFFNPIDNSFRTSNINKTINNIDSKLCKIYVVELCYLNQVPHYFDSKVEHFVFKSNFILWHKENLINLCVKNLPNDWENVAWIDSDLLFSNPNWIDQCINLLKRKDVIQLFSNCSFLNKDLKIQKSQIGFINSIFNKLNLAGHCGYAWAINRNCYDSIGGLFENSIIGGGDKWMCQAFVQSIDENWIDVQPRGLFLNFNKYYKKCKNLKYGYLNQEISHLYHGTLGSRRYIERHEFLKMNNFDPELHLCKDENGILAPSTLCPSSIIDGISNYFHSRLEI